TTPKYLLLPSLAHTQKCREKEQTTSGASGVQSAVEQYLVVLSRSQLSGGLGQCFLDTSEGSTRVASRGSNRTPTTRRRRNSRSSSRVATRRRSRSALLVAIALPLTDRANGSGMLQAKRAGTVTRRESLVGDDPGLMSSTSNGSSDQNQAAAPHQ